MVAWAGIGATDPDSISSNSSINSSGGYVCELWLPLQHLDREWFLFVADSCGWALFSFIYYYR